MVITMVDLRSVMFSILSMVWVIFDSYYYINKITEYSLTKNKYKIFKKETKGIKWLTLSNHRQYVPTIFYIWYLISVVILIPHCICMIILFYFDIQNFPAFIKRIPWFFLIPSCLFDMVMNLTGPSGHGKEHFKRLMKKEYKYRKKR